MLIAGARSMAGGTETILHYDAEATPQYWRTNVQEIGAFPNDQQGFGRISLEDVLSPYPLRYFVNETSPLLPTQPWSKTLTIHDPTLPVKIALVWSDPPWLVDPAHPEQTTTTTPLVNDLNLRIDLGSPCSKRYVGNRLTIVDTAVGEVSLDQGCNNGNLPFDLLNNVEIARFVAPAGTTTFTVFIENASGMANAAQNFALVAYNAYDTGSTSLPVGTPMISPLDTTSSTRITFSWTAVSGAPTGYDVRRKSGLSGESVYGTPRHVTGTSFDSLTDGGALLTPNTAYIYQVRATRPPFASAWSAPDLATTSQYTHAGAANHVAAGDTIAAVDITELRTVINSVRMAAGFTTPFPFTDPGLASGFLIRAAHISELRSALNQARTSLGLSAATYTDTGIVVKAAHINDLRDGVQ
ncbi:MAG: hypothetical protein QOC81_692 [Thermoanaerobaculia bacterium]|jgi:hypothetical protein|nr:hypothetical protein [Thermoanaerobaculia bacterium]